MKKPLVTMLLFAGLGLTAPTWAPAQTTTETEAPAAESDGEATGVESELSLGEDANAVPAIGEPYAKEENGAWTLRCIRTQSGDDPCQAYQLLEDDQGTPVAEVSLFRLPAGGKAEAGATVVVPLETSLQAQLTISIDSGSSRRYPYSFCNPIGCYARIGLTPEDVAAFKRGALATLTIVPVIGGNQKVEIEMSLTGFTATYDKASTLEQN